MARATASPADGKEYRSSPLRSPAGPDPALNSLRSFDHATFTNADNKTYPFVADLPDVSVPTTCVMRNAAGTKTTATPSRPDSGNDGFTVADGKTAPPPPKS